MIWLMVMCLLVWTVALVLSCYSEKKLYEAITGKKASDMFVVCELCDDKLIPRAFYSCEADARKHSLFMAKQVIVRVRKSELELLRSIKHVSD